MKYVTNELRDLVKLYDLSEFRVSHLTDPVFSGEAAERVEVKPETRSRLWHLFIV